MATIRQQQLANNIVLNLQEQRWKRLQDLLINSGYSELVGKKNAKNIIQRPGVQKVLESMGFNETAVRAIVSEIMFLGEESNRLRAVDIINKMLGLYAPEKQVVLHGDIATLIDKLNKYEEIPQSNPSH